MKKKLLLVLLFTILFLTIVSATNPQTNNTTIKFSIDNQETTAKMIHNPTSDEFLELLPLNLELKDLYSREKYAQLPTDLTTQTEKTEEYKVGYVAYYPPTNSFVVYYKDDKEKIPSGIILLAIIEDNIEMFEANNTNVTIEMV